mgnify:CR=1 FL=1
MLSIRSHPACWMISRRSCLTLHNWMNIQALAAAIWKKEVITENGTTTTYDSENEDQEEEIAAVAGGLGRVTDNGC